MNSNLLKVGKTITAYFSASAIPMALNLMTTPLIAMNMSPEDFAIVGYFTSFVPLLSPLVSFYFLHYFLIRFYECNESERLELKAAVFKLLIYYSAIATLFCFLGVWGYIAVFNKEIQFDVFPYLPLALLSMPLTGLYSLELTDYKMQKDSRSYFRLSVVSGVLSTVAVVVMVVVLKMQAFGKLLAPLLINLAVFLYLLLKHRNLLKIKVSKGYVGAMFKFCWPLAAAAMLGYFTNGFDKTYLESVGNVTEYGYYCVAVSMATYLQAFAIAIANTFQPDIFEAIAAHDNRKFFSVCGIQLGLLSMVVICFILLCPLIVRILTAGRYMDSVSYTRILSIATVTSALQYNVHSFTIAKGYPKLSLWAALIGSGLVILAMSFAVNHWTFSGGAWMVSLSFIIFSLVNVVLLMIVSGRSRVQGFIRSLFH